MTRIFISYTIETEKIFYFLFTFYNMETLIENVTGKIEETLEKNLFCVHCQNLFSENDGGAHYPNNDYVCENCYCDLGLSTCEECGEISEDIFKTADDYFYCEHCAIRNGYEKCEDCGEWSRNTYTLIDNLRGDTIILCENCEGCGCSEHCESCGNSFSERYRDNYGVYNSRREAWFCEDCAPNNKDLFQYHSGEGRDFTEEAEASRFCCGFEVEKEDGDILETIDCNELLQNTGWVAEEDGSLDQQTGFELISPVFPLDPEFLQTKFEEVEEYLTADFSDNCGGHIHVSDKERTPEQIADDVKGYLPLIYALYPERARRNYSKAYKFDELKQRGGHGVALNIGSKTLEFRIFPSTKRIKTFVWRAEFLKFLLENKRTNFIEVLNVDIFQKSGLYDLLLKEYTEDEIKEKINLSIEFGKEFEELAPSFEFNY